MTSLAVANTIRAQMNGLRLIGARNMTASHPAETFGALTFSMVLA